MQNVTDINIQMMIATKIHPKNIMPQLQIAHRAFALFNYQTRITSPQASRRGDKFRTNLSSRWSMATKLRTSTNCTPRWGINSPGCQRRSASGWTLLTSQPGTQGSGATQPLQAIPAHPLGIVRVAIRPVQLVSHRILSSLLEALHNSCFTTHLGKVRARSVPTLLRT